MPRNSRPCGEETETDRLEFQRNQYAELESAIRSGLKQIEDKVGAAVTRILAPFLDKQLVKHAADELCKAIARLGAAGSPGSMTIRGPERAARAPASADRRFAGHDRLCRGPGRRGGRRGRRDANRDCASLLGRAARRACRLSGVDDRAASGNRHRQAPRLARGRASWRRLEDRLRRFHDCDDGVLSGAVDYQRHRQEHQDAHRALLQSGEGRGTGEGAKGHPRRAGKGRLPAGRGFSCACRRKGRF